MAVKDKVAKMLYVDNTTAQFIKEIAGLYECSESAIMRKALQNYVALYKDLAKKGKEYSKRQGNLL